MGKTQVGEWLGQHLQILSLPAFVLTICFVFGGVTLLESRSSASRIPIEHEFSRLAQLGSGASETEATPAEVDKYIAAYKAMQHNHDLTVEQAAAQQGLTLQQFRKIEARVERDDVVRQRVRRALRGPTSKRPSANDN